MIDDERKMLKRAFQTIFILGMWSGAVLLFVIQLLLNIWSKS